MRALKLFDHPFPVPIWLAGSLCLAGLGCAAAGDGDAPPAGRQAAAETVAFRTRTMGTWATLTLVTPDSAAVADLALTALLLFHHTDSLLTNWTATSEVARLNRTAGEGPTPTNPEVTGILAVARQVSAASGGAFDITVEPLVRLWGFLGGPRRVPTAAEIASATPDVGWQLVRLDPDRGTVAYARPGVRIDLGGIAKGHGVDQVAAFLRRNGVDDALIDLSGNLVALGHPPGRSSWVIGIRDPDDRAPHLATLLVSDRAVATSGDYEQFLAADGRRYGHILDPRTGWPAHGLASATVVTDRAVVADAWATALFVLGPAEARALAARRPDLSAVFVTRGHAGRDTVWVEADLRPWFALNPALAESLAVGFF